MEMVEEKHRQCKRQLESSNAIQNSMNSECEKRELDSIRFKKRESRKNTKTNKK